MSENNILFHISDDEALTKNPTFVSYILNTGNIKKIRKLGAIQGLKARVRYMKQYQSLFAATETMEHYTKLVTQKNNVLKTETRRYIDEEYEWFRNNFRKLSKQQWLELSNPENILHMIRKDTTKVLYETRESIQVYDIQTFHNRILKPDSTYYIASCINRYQ